MALQDEIDIKLHGPCRALNKLLVIPYAVQPELSKIAADAGMLAVAIAHFGEPVGLKSSGTNSPHIALMQDVADGWKHGASQLRDSARRHVLTVESMAEWREGQGYRWLRNAIIVRHASLGRVDFMLEAARAIGWWVNQNGSGNAKPWQPKVLEGSGDFEPAIRVLLNVRFQPRLNKMIFTTVVRQTDDTLVPTDPTDEVHVAFAEAFEDLRVTATWKAI